MGMTGVCELAIGEKRGSADGIVVDNFPDKVPVYSENKSESRSEENLKSEQVKIN